MKKNRTNLGADLVLVQRIREVKNRERFLRRVFTQDERAYIEGKNGRAETIAGLFAAKEAIAKVLGTGLGPVSFQDIEIRHDSLGRPYGVYQPQGTYIPCSISHDQAFALAVALGERIQPAPPSDLPRIPARSPETHKGDYGHLALIGGSTGMAGSIHLATEASLRSGVGIAYTVVPESIADVIQYKALENIVLPWQEEEGGLAPGLWQGLLKEGAFDALALGCGMGRYPAGGQVLAEILDHYQGPLVLDADGLYHLGQQLDKLLGKDRLVLTPHPKEFSRLIQVEVGDILAKPLDYALAFTRRYPGVLVLKLHQTLVVQGERVYCNSTGNPGMATGGSGDVLTGIIGGFLAQGYEPFQAAQWGVYLHGLAGDLALDQLGEESLLPRDLIACLGQAILQMKEQ